MNFKKIMINFLVHFVILTSFYVHYVKASQSTKGAMCTYSTWEWNTLSKTSVGHRTVVKPYSELTTDEKDSHSNCTVCEEDQTTIAIEGIKPFRVCKYYAAQVKDAVKKIVDSGFPVTAIISYRVGRTKGDVNSKGLRTRFSNHSFGTAIDLNSEKNGLYTNCYEFGKNCQLLRGGHWKPGTITKTSAVYKTFKEIGWHWAGELQGRQKDFMHFSLSGD
jgi:hypothetical protein